MLIILRLFYFQIYLQSNFYHLGKRNFLRSQVIHCPRGNITDAYGKLLATNRPVISLYWQGSGNRQLSCDQESVLNQLKHLIRLGCEKNDIETAEKFSRKIRIARDLSMEELSKLLEQIPEHKNLIINTAFERIYPHESLACHVIGYLGSMQIEPTGKMGLEKLFENRLKGEKGILEITINSFGKNLYERKLKNALIGASITTTIDLSLQKLAEEVFPEQYSGSFILMEADTGAIRALVSRPKFDSNMFLKSISQKEWNSLQEKQPFINRAFSACYPPASPFKLVTLAAALDIGLIDENTTWNCKGSMTFGGRTYFCNKRSGHGELTGKQAIAQSCNIPFFELGKQIHIDTLADYAKKFGFGQKTNSAFPEKPGLVPTSSWKLETKGEPWWPGETISATVGQSYLLATPIQNACIVSAIIEGYFVRPRILVDEPIEKKPLELDAKIRSFLKKSMKKVITKGTGSQLSKMEDIIIYAKTGTAQLCSLTKKNKTEADKAHAWFIAHFTNKNESPLVLVILLENAGAARYALAVAKQFLQHYCTMH